MRTRYITEYRINKKGAECFRSRTYDDIKVKLAELRKKKPNALFEVQTRHCPLNRYGDAERDYKGRPAWDTWH